MHICIYIEKYQSKDIYNSLLSDFVWLLFLYDFIIDAAKVRLDIEEYNDVYAIADLLKQYLRELPEPLLTNAYKDFFLENTGMYFLSLFNIFHDF